MQYGDDMCKIKGCGRESMYKIKDLCQMHYFRFMRNGTYETTLTRKYRRENPAGYQLVYEPDHILASSNGYVYEQRFVYFNEISETVTFCALCGCKIDWKDCHIDHIDEDVTNNDKDNLRSLCRGCNVFRGHSRTSMGKHLLTANGITMTAAAWARADGVEVAGATIARRKSLGASDYDAIFGKRKTHHNTKTKKLTMKHDKVRGIKP